MTSGSEQLSTETKPIAYLPGVSSPSPAVELRRPRKCTGEPRPEAIPLSGAVVSTLKPTAFALSTVGEEVSLCAPAVYKGV